MSRVRIQKDELQFFDFPLRPEEEPPWEVIAACSYLRAKGYRYIDHFNFSNALGMAEEVYATDLPKRDDL